ncbi:MAG: SLC13 family permease [bacterium]
MEILLVSILLIGTMVLLVSEWLPLDLTAIGVMVALMATGLLPPAEALAGFSNPAPITVGALFVVSAGLTRTGALDVASQWIVALTKGRPLWFLLICLVLTGLLSAFVSNTPVVILFISIVMAYCCKHQQSPSKFLIPVSYMSILAGTCTLIGTSTNIIVSDLGKQMGCREIQMFELSALGVPIALAGGAFLFFLSGRLLPGHKEPVCELKDGERQRYLSEVEVPKGSRFVGQEPLAALRQELAEAEVFEVIRGREVLDPREKALALADGDRLLIKGSVGDLLELLEGGSVVLPTDADAARPKPYHRESMIAELIVPPNSPLVGERLSDTELVREETLHIIGVKRRHQRYGYERASQLRLAVGDILLVQGPQERFRLLSAAGDVVVVDDVFRIIRWRRRAWWAVGIFVAMVLAAATGLVNILVAALGAAFLMVAAGCLRLHTAYRSVDVKVLLLIIGTIALGRALQRTGAADLYAQTFLRLFAGAGPHVVLGGFILLTSLLSHVLSNNSTAALLVPFALSTAVALGVDPRPFLIGICFGASACYATPIGYQTNLLVYEPGGYRFGDYLRLGLPLNLLVCLSAAIFIPYLWSF